MPDVPDTLAALGGKPVRSTPLPTWPSFSSEEIAAAERVLRSGKVNSWTGLETGEFEREFASFTRRAHAVALANGTVALELALHSLGVGDGDEVIVPARTFIATASAAVMRGATPVCADVDRDSGCVTGETLRAALTPRTRAIIVVHLGGWVADMEAILDFAREHDLFVVEDVAQALGGAFKGRPAGSFGHMATFSFCQDKIMTTAGEGGMLVCDDDALWQTARSFKDHGKSQTALDGSGSAPSAGFRWLHDSFGTNWRMTEFQSAVGRVALRSVPDWVERRREISARLSEAMSEFAVVRCPDPSVDVYHASYRHYVYVKPELLADGWSRSRIAEAITAEGIPCMSGSCSEIYLERAFLDAGFAPERPLPVAHELGETSLAFLVHPTLEDADVADMCAAVRKVLSHADNGALNRAVDDTDSH